MTQSHPSRFTIGTLVYSRKGLAALFLWLLWGDFCLTFMEQVIPSVLPIKLRGLDIPSWMIAAILTSLPTALSTVAAPIISFKSDRCRTRWGRRLPFIVASTPFVALFLGLMAFSPEIGTWFHYFLPGLTSSPTAGIVLFIAIFMAGYRFFDLANGMLFQYLLNDVVPKDHLSRFYSLFRIVGIIASALYNWFIFRYAGTHMREILVWSGIFYFIGFLIMCFHVKEGEYPPPPPLIEKRKGMRASVETYFRECFSHRLYWYYFLHTACWSIGGATALFVVFLNLSLGITLGQHGKILGIGQILTALLLYPAGVLADRIHPMRVMVWVKTGLLLTLPLNMIWLFKSWSPQTNFYVLIVLTAMTLPLNVMYLAAFSPMVMRLLPADRFGQFWSANLMLMSLAGIVSGVAVGFFFDAMRRFFPDAVWGQDFCYRFLPIWPLFFFTIGWIFLLLLYRQWKRCGGPDAYIPPHVTIDSESPSTHHHAIS